jgi:hypothetical protein
LRTPHPPSPSPQERGELRIKNLKEMRKAEDPDMGITAFCNSGVKEGEDAMERKGESRTSIYPPNIGVTTEPQGRKPIYSDAGIRLWQVCPLCQGTGRVADNIMYGTPYTSDYVTNNTAGHTCPVCNGKRIIPTP